jgi:RNA polymerase sigma factor (sigma-70 family)
MGSRIGGLAHSNRDVGIPSGTPRWPTHLRNLYCDLRASRDDARDQRVLTEFWLLLRTAISRYVRFHASSWDGITREDIEDIAAQKSLDLFCKAKAGQWDPSGHRPDEIAGYLSTVARHGLVDHLRKSGREIKLGNADSAAYNPAGPDTQNVVHHSKPPDVPVQRREFIQALRGCADRLAPRSRLIWLFRVFYDMTSKEIARHPEVCVKASHVDVLLQRARKILRECMGEKGFDPKDTPPGAFVELWKAFRLGRVFER